MVPVPPEVEHSGCGTEVFSFSFPIRGGSHKGSLKDAAGLHCSEEAAATPGGLDKPFCPAEEGLLAACSGGGLQAKYSFCFVFSQSCIPHLYKMEAFDCATVHL